ncbi:hypothetical protein DSM3645_14960 [Blastopirellula marina DSM 3645]|uniref:Uncharacterized protein n=1 Tax=Blastopirellula marina DSM 3645 TaxID=314230 RepID=A3ZSJ6_9BACT|nr:hypothetical protein DSM3645_14960 [Blastopirellula marina DSM 3645]
MGKRRQQVGEHQARAKECFLDDIDLFIDSYLSQSEC